MLLEKTPAKEKHHMMSACYLMRYLYEMTNLEVLLLIFFKNMYLTIITWLNPVPLQS